MKREFRFLIVGSREMEAGKTALARALLHCLHKVGIKACGFKPKAGNTLWYDYDIVCEGLEQGRLYGKDARLLKDASNTDLPEELISPIHRLWAIPPHYLKEKLATLPYFIVDRITLWDADRREIIVVNDTLSFKYSREELVARLHRPKTEVLHVKTLRRLNGIIKKNYGRAIETVHDRISVEHDAIVYESYADVALPWKGITDLDLVLAIHPGYIQAYNPEKYFSAVSLLTRLRRELKTAEIVNLLKSIKTIEVPPYKNELIIPRLRRKLFPLVRATCTN